MIDYRIWPEDGRIWLAQGHDSCCFVYAVANCRIALGKSTPIEMLEGACKIGCCETGNVINPAKVVDFLQVPLVEAESIEQVWTSGGIVQIWHPIFNGHSFYIDRLTEGHTLRMINSWLGPPVVTGVGASEIRPFVTDRCGSHWKIHDQ